MNAQLAGGRPEGESLELGLLHILPQSPLASSGYLPFGSNVFALGRQELAEGPVLSPGLRPAVRRPVVRTGKSHSRGHTEQVCQKADQASDAQLGP